MRAREFSPRKLVIFDIDDTLVHTQTKVRVLKDGKVVKELNSHDFTHYKLQPGEEFDFENFRNAQEFFNNSKPIIPMMNQLKQDIATGNKVVMVTARADFDDRELFLDTFRKYGVDMGKVHVYRAGNMTQKVQTEEKKKIIIRNLLDKGNYTKAIMYDDAVPNLTSFVELKDEYANTKFYAWHVSLEGEASEFHRTNETQSLEERKKKRRVRRDAYGPGPFGGYGYYAGYSGDSGASAGGGDGGGGESIRELFDGGKDWKWTYQDKNQASAEFTVGNVRYTFMAGQDPDEAPGDWDIEFAAKQAHGTASWGVTGTGNSAQVFGTVVEIMKAFITSKKASIRRMTFAAKEDSRQGLYARMVKRLLPKWNLEQNGEAFVLTKPGGLVFWVYSVEAPYNKIPAVKVKANSAREAEQIVLTTMPEFKGADLMGMGASKNKPNLNETVISETAMMGKIADSGKIIRILKKAHTVPFSDEKNWLLVDMDPAKGNKGLGIKWIPADTRFEWVRPYRDTVDENIDNDAAREYRAHLIKTLPQIMKLFANIGKGWIPSKEQMLSAVDTAYRVMKHTGNAKQAGKVLMDELNTLYRMSKNKQDVAEARTSPDQNTKPESGMKELQAVAETITDPENWAISMTAEPKLGINPQVGISEDTPKGIYFYPLDYTVDLARRGKKLPWGDNLPYIQLFQYDRSGEMTKETQVDPARLKQALGQYCPAEVIQQAIAEPEYDGTPYWTIYDCLSRLGKSDETNVVRWNKVLRDLGFTSVFDPGAGWIAYNEPTQGVVLDPRIIKQHKTISNKKQSRVVTPAVIEKAIFDTLDIELAANRAWQAYDPDGSKLRVAAKEYAKKPEFKQWFGKPGSEEIFDKAASWGRYGARELSQTAWVWYKEQQAQNVAENFADGKNPQDKGDSKRHGVPTKASVSTLRKVAKQGGRKGQLAHWMANMKAGRNK